MHSYRLRIWGSGVRISPGAPAKSSICAHFYHKHLPRNCRWADHGQIPSVGRKSSFCQTELVGAWAGTTPLRHVAQALRGAPPSDGIAGLGSAAAWPVVARAQQAGMPVIGYLSTQSADDEYKNFTVPFLQGLKEIGYVEGQNVAIEYRWAERGGSLA